MLLILHGENHLQSRNALTHQIQVAKSANIFDIVTLNGKNIDLTDLEQALESNSMFGSNRLVILESLFTNPKKTLLKTTLKYLADLKPDSYHLILWEPKLLTAAQVKNLAQFKVQAFKTSPLIFSFLESLKPGQSPNFKTLESIFTTDSPEFFFFMLCRHLRLLLIAQNDTPPGAPWQVNKLKNQARLFSSAQILSLYHQLLSLDYRAKTGQLPLNLKFELERLLLKLSSA